MIGLGRRRYYHATDSGSSSWVEALQSNDKHFLPIAAKGDQFVFRRCSIKSMLPLQAIRINIGVDCAEKVFHSFPFTLIHHLPRLMDNRVTLLALLERDQDK